MELVFNRTYFWSTRFALLVSGVPSRKYGHYSPDMSDEEIKEVLAEHERSLSDQLTEIVELRGQISDLKKGHCKPPGACSVPVPNFRLSHPRLNLGKCSGRVVEAASRDE
jgi:hypothetical protein